MDFISKVIDINGTEFVSLKELRLSGYDTDRLSLFQSYEIKYISVDTDPRPDNLIPEGFRNLQIEMLKPFVYSCGIHWVKHDPTYKIIDEYTISRNCSSFEGRLQFRVLFYIFPIEIFKNLHPKVREICFIVPFELNDGHDLPEHKIFYRISDISQTNTQETPQVLTDIEFIASIRKTVNKIYAVTQKTYGKEALALAIGYLERNPCDKIDPSWLTTETFRQCAEPHVSYRCRIVSDALIHNGYKKLQQNEIKKILSNISKKS